MQTRENFPGERLPGQVVPRRIQSPDVGHPLLAIQRTAGNRAVSEALQRQRQAGSSAVQRQNQHGPGTGMQAVGDVSVSAAATMTAEATWQGRKAAPELVLRLRQQAGNRGVAGGFAVQRDCGCGGGTRDCGCDDVKVQRQSPGSGACATRCGGISPSCPPPFCCPFPLGTATVIRENLRVPFLAAIASQVRASVVPVWAMWFNGGTSTQDFTARFGADFTGDPTTARVAARLAVALPGQVDSAALHRLAVASVPGSEVSLLPALRSGHLASTTAALEAPGAGQMNFNAIGTAPGNLAGGVGKTQTTCAVGATPSPVDDARELLDVRGALTRQPDGSVTVVPRFQFKVTDTVDLCPGDCGSSLGVINEQLATFPMSRLEASGVCGDVPFFVNFPSAAQASFVVPPPAPPAPVVVTISSRALFDFGSDTLRPDAAAALLAQLGDGPTHADLTQPFRVEGHTDTKGSDAFNQGLSERRARAVGQLLKRTYPNLVGHLTPVGFGETRPVAPNESADGADNPPGRQQNRRVELHFSAPPP